MRKRVVKQADEVPKVRDYTNKDLHHMKVLEHTREYQIEIHLPPKEEMGTTRIQMLLRLMAIDASKRKFESCEVLQMKMS